jgi:uncharacterized repeat protein (TIGR01451 family)
VGRHFTVESGTGGLPSDPFPDRCSSLYGSIERAVRGVPRTWRTSAVGHVARGFDERALPGAVRRSNNGSCRGRLGSSTVDLRYGYLIQPCHVPLEVVAVRDCSSASRPAQRRTALVGFLAAFVSFTLLTGVAAADTVTTTFEPLTFHLGTVNGQDGWHSAVPGNVPALPNGYDQAVVPSGGVAGFGTQSLRHSNAYSENTGEFEFQTYSRSNAVNAGDALPNTQFVGEFQFTSTSPELQDQLHMRISPDDGHGGRMSFVGLRDTAAGIEATIYDTPDADGEFKAYPAGIYSRDAVHTVRFLLQLVPGPDNDIVHIVIDGVDIGNQLGVCLTTWENFYRATDQAVPVTNSLQFRSANPGGNPGLVIPNLVGHGYLFDNVITDTTPANGAVPTVCGEEPPPIVIDKTTQTRSARPGDLVTYRITVTNRGHAPVRGLRACDRAPRALRLVRSTARLQAAAGHRLCLTTGRLGPGQRQTFRATFRLRANATAATVTNGASLDIPTGSPPLPSTGAAPLPPDTAVIPESRRRVLSRATAAIRVRRTVAPKFTG